MRKNFIRQPQVPFLPTILQPSSRNDFQTTIRKAVKENDNVQNITNTNFKIEPAHHCLAKRNISRDKPSVFDELLNKKLLEKEGLDIPTQPKANRPWLANQRDLNNLATKTNRLQPVKPKNGSVENLRRKSCHNNTSSSRESSFRITTIDRTTRLPRNLNLRTKSLQREKINSCKIAVKKGIFPLDQKKFEYQKMVDFFEQEQKISTIYDKERSQADFMSFDSYRQIEF